MYTRDNQKLDGKDYSFGLNLYSEDFQFVPESVVNRGIISDDRQYWFRSVLEPSFQEKFAPYSKPFSVQNIAEVSPNTKFLEDYEKSGFTDERGYLVPKDVARELFDKYSSYPVNEVTKEGFVYGPITGLATNEQGVKYYNVAASGKEGATAWVAPGATEAQGQYVIPGEKKKWYESPLGLVSGGALLLSGLGLAGIGPLATGTAAAGTGAAAGGIVGTPGVSTIFPVAAPIAPTVTTIAPMAAAGGAAAIGAGSSAIPAGLEVAPSFTPAPGSLQATLPSLGVETAASAAPFTAIPGSFQAALPALGIASAPSLAGNLTVGSSGISATDALRIANQARGLLGAGQNPIVPQQQGLPQQAGGAQGVDYSGLLSLLQLQAKTPGVSSLTQPAQLRQMYQTTLLPDVLSLLG